MKPTVVIMIRDPELRNKIASAFRRGGRDVLIRHQAEGWAPLLESRSVGGFVFGMDLADADPEHLLRKARAARDGLFLATVETIGDDEYRVVHDDVEHVESSSSRLGGWLSACFDKREERNVTSKPLRRVEHAADCIYGTSEELQRILRVIDTVAPTESTVLLQGESGTGKDLLARLIHEKSRRSSESLVEVHCGAIPPSLMESELFGHEKGSFTGASSRKVGLFLSAECGTLFLDEIGELPLDMQVKLLRVLQSGWLRPVGATHSIKVDVRVIAATNRNLKEEVLAGRFRLDLYYRLNVIGIVIPPLRDRRDDIPGLVQFIMGRLSRKGMETIEFPPDIMRELVEYRWPGNVRELENIVERLLLLYPDGGVSLRELRAMLLDVRVGGDSELLVESAPIGAVSVQGALPYAENLTLRELERLHIRRVLKKHRGNKTRAARALGINVKTLYNKMKAAGITREEFLEQSTS